ncbi:MAG: hypothetical protein DSY37_03650 [Hyperthermus sp.]|nr:MAG: hypothetical protein DSY37_03650 [Hyperthermus sp.]
MSKVALTFHTGGVYTVDTDGWELIDSGGEADIYRFNMGGKGYIAKVFTEKYTALAKPIERVAEMLRRLTRIRRRCGGAIPSSLIGRGLPVAFGAFENRAVLVFHELKDFTTVSELIATPDLLEEYVSRHPPEERRAFARRLLTGIACLEAADIVHVDLTTANTAYGSLEGERGVFLFDYETAGLMGAEDYPLIVLPARDAYYLPVEALKEAGINIDQPDPGELPLNLSPSQLPDEIISWLTWTPTWYGLQLVAYVHAGVSLFYGLPMLSPKHWLEILEGEAQRGYPGSWPPLTMLDQGYLDQSEHLELTKIWRDLGEDYVALVYQVFIADPAEKMQKPTQTISSILR